MKNADNKDNINSPVISVIIPVYNTEKYLNRCLRSIVSNDFKNLQIICVNDGSTDSSGKLLNRWVQKDSRVEVVTTLNRGAAEARNVGIRHIKGDYVCFIDSDDWVLPQYFSVLLSAIVNSNANVSLCDFQYDHSEDESDLNELPNFSDIKWDLLETKQFLNLRTVRRTVWGKLYKKELIQPQFVGSLQPYEDLPFNLTILFNNPEIKFAFVKLPLYRYYVRSGSLTNSRNRKESKVAFDYFMPIAENSVRNSNILGQYIYVIETVKCALAFRYDSKFDKLCKESAKETCSQALKLLLSANKTITWKVKFLYSIFLLFPPVYRWFRIINDPTLLKWEKGQRIKSKSKVVSQ